MFWPLLGGSRTASRLHVTQEEFERADALLSPAGDMFGDDDDMFAENTENDEPRSAATSSPPNPSRPSDLTTPRVSFSFPEIMGDSNGSTPRLQSASPTENQWQQQQQAEPASSSAAAQQLQHVENGAAAAQVQAPNGDAARPSAGQLPAEEAEVDYHSWPVRELRRFLTERGVVSCFHAPSVLRPCDHRANTQESLFTLPFLLLSLDSKHCI